MDVFLDTKVSINSFRQTKFLKIVGSSQLFSWLRSMWSHAVRSVVGKFSFKVAEFQLLLPGERTNLFTSSVASF